MYTNILLPGLWISLQLPLRIDRSVVSRTTSQANSEDSSFSQEPVHREHPLSFRSTPAWNQCTSSYATSHKSGRTNTEGYGGRPRRTISATSLLWYRHHNFTRFQRFHITTYSGCFTSARDTHSSTNYRIQAKMLPMKQALWEEDIEFLARLTFLDEHSYPWNRSRQDQYVIYMYPAAWNPALFSVSSIILKTPEKIALLNCPEDLRNKWVQPQHQRWSGAER